MSEASEVVTPVTGAAPAATEQAEPNDTGAARRVADAPAKTGRSGRGLAALALLVAMLGVVASAGMAWRLQQQLAGSSSPAMESGVVEALSRQQAKAQQDLSLLAGELSTQQQVMATVQDSQRALSQQQLAADLGLAGLSGRLDELANTDATDWKLAEIEFLLRLANQRVLTSYDTAGAIALLESADRICNDLGLAQLFNLRGQLAEDIAALRATSQLDVEGTYLQLSALGKSVDQLVFSGPPVLPAASAEQSPADAAIEQPPQSGWRKAWSALASLVRVTPRKLEVQPQLTLDQRLLLRAQLRLLLEQAKNALLLRQQAIFGASLEQATSLLTTYFEAGDPATVAALATSAKLQGLEVAPGLPNISGSQALMHELLQARSSRRGPAQ